MSDKPIYVFDACALIALIRQESGAEVIEDILFDANSDCVIHVVNLCEVAYDSLRNQPRFDPSEWTIEVEALGMRIVWNIDPAVFAKAAELKAFRKRISLADCFALALTFHLQGRLLTSDHHEFDPLVQSGFNNIEFFR